MLQEYNPLHRLLGKVLEERFSERLVVNQFVLPYLTKSKEGVVDALSSALYNHLPPWEDGKKLIEPLQRLGCYWAYGLIRLVYVSPAKQFDRIGIYRRSMRLASRLDARLEEMELIAHRKYFLGAMRERLAAWSMGVHVMREFLNGTPIPIERGVFVERLLVAETYKGSLFARLIKAMLENSSNIEINSLRRTIARTIDEGFANPWHPVFDEDDAAMEMLVTEGLAKCDRLQITGLLNRVSSRELIQPENEPNARFIEGLTRNPHFGHARDRLLKHLFC